MECLGGVASGITIWDLAVRAKQFCDKVRCAPDKWTRYCQELENLAHVEAVLNDMINTSDAIKKRKIEVEGGETEPLVKFMADRIEKIRNEAASILDRYEQLNKQSYKTFNPRIWKWFRRNLTAYKFVLDDQDIQHLIKAAEHAKTCLQSLLCLVHLESLEPWQQQTQNDFRSIHENMRKHAEALERLHRDENLGQLTLQVVQERADLPYIQSHNRSSLSLGPSISESTRSSKIGKGLGEAGEKTKNFISAVSITFKRGHGRAQSRAGAGEGTGQKARETTYEDGPEAHADMHDTEYAHPSSDTDGEAIDDDRSSSLGCSGTMAQGRDPERKYDLIYRDNKILTIDINTEEYKALISESRGETRHPKTIRLHDAFKPMSDEKWTNCVESSPGKLINILSSAVCSDVETTDGERLGETFRGDLEPTDEERLEVTDHGAVEAGSEERPEDTKEATLGNPHERTADAIKNTNPKDSGEGAPGATDGSDSEAANERVEPIGESTVAVAIDRCHSDATNKKRVIAQNDGVPKVADEVTLDAAYEASLGASAVETVGGISESTIEVTNRTASEGSPEDIDEMTFNPINEITLKATDGEGPEVASDVTLIKIDFERPNVAFFSATIDLKSGLAFCVGAILRTEPCQTLLVQEPCQDSCQHATLMIQNEVKTQTPPYNVTLQVISCHASLEVADVADPRPGLTSKSAQKCKNQSVCSHTVVEGFPGRQDACLLPGLPPVSIHAWLDDEEWESESETPTERDDSDTEEETFPSDPAQDDDMRAFFLINAIKHDTESYDVPTEVSFDVLVEFLKLMDKYSLQEPYLACSRGWTNALLPSIPTGLDQDAIAWLWVLWRLQIKAEFKELSGIVQKQAKCRIDEDTNTYGVKLPEHIVEAMERRRVSALSTVRDCVASIIEQFRHDYVDGFDGGPDWSRTLTKMGSAMTIGYLTLESEACFSYSHATRSVDFCGVSFQQTSRWARSLADLGDWMVRTVPPAHRMPTFLADLTMFVPLFGAGLREAGISTCLSSRVKEQLVETIKELETQDWGLDLT